MVGYFRLFVCRLLPLVTVFVVAVLDDLPVLRLVIVRSGVASDFLCLDILLDGLPIGKKKLF